MTGLSKNSVTKLIIGEEEGGQRLDNYLFRICKGIPKSHVYRILRSGEVRINSGRVTAAYRLQAGDLVRLPPMRYAANEAEEASEEVRGQALKADLPVLYEDDALVVINKPAGIAVHGGSGVSFGVIEALRQQRPQAKFLELAHRLDRETSGILLVAKKRSALTALHDMFREGGRSDKRYLTLVSGRWMDKVRNVRLPLYKYLLDNGERRVRVAPDGKPSHTVFRLMSRWQRFSLLEAQLKTGRTHQIRVHLSHSGFPIAGDDKYGDFEINKALQKQGLKRMFLHAYQMRFPHPITGESLSVAAPLPTQLQQFLDFLNRTESLEYGAPL